MFAMWSELCGICFSTLGG